MPKSYLNTSQVAELFKVDNSTVRRWTLSKKLRCMSSSGGHRKFSYKQILDFVNSNSTKMNLNLDIIAEVKNSETKSDLIDFIVDNALNRNSADIESLFVKLYLKGNKVSKIFDNYVELGLEKIQRLLDRQEISVAEEHIARKTVSKALGYFGDIVSKDSKTKKTSLCLNIENDIPDLAIDMIQIVLESINHSVYNSGSHTSIKNLRLLLSKNTYDSIYIYMCNRQCCSATVKDNLGSTIKSLEEIAVLSKKYSIDLFIGGPSTDLIDDKISFNYTKFNKFSEILN